MLMIKSIQSQLADKFQSLLDRNTYGITYKKGEFIQQSTVSFALVNSTNYYTQNTVKYAPIMYQFESINMNMPKKDIQQIGITFFVAVEGENEKDDKYVKARNALEQLRNQINRYPLNTFIFNDTPYQNIFNDTNKQTLQLLPTTEYTILSKVLEFNDDVGFTVVDGLSIDGLSITTSSAGLIKQKFTTGANPTNEFKQYTNGTAGNVIIRSFLIKGDYTTLSDEEALNLIEDKTMGDLKNLLDNSNDLQAWTDVDVYITTKEYNTISSASMLTAIGGINIGDGKKHTLVTMKIFTELGIGITFGNEVTYQMKKLNGTYESFLPVSVDFTSGKAEDNNQIIGEESTRTLSVTKSREITISLYDENLTFINDLIQDEIVSGDMNQTYFLKYTLRSPIGTVEKELILTGGTIPFKTNGKTILTFRFKEAL